jgi:ankyrin repeat protein
MIDNGVDFRSRNDYAFRRAIETGREDIIKLLIERGADVNCQNNYAFSTACRRNHVSVVKLLVEHGADIHVKEAEIMLEIEIQPTDRYFELITYLSKQYMLDKLKEIT